jgi:hypothetical protein
MGIYPAEEIEKVKLNARDSLLAISPWWPLRLVIPLAFLIYKSDEQLQREDFCLIAGEFGTFAWIC